MKTRIVSDAVYFSWTSDLWIWIWFLIQNEIDAPIYPSNGDRFEIFVLQRVGHRSVSFLAVWIVCLLDRHLRLVLSSA